MTDEDNNVPDTEKPIFTYEGEREEDGSAVLKFTTKKLLERPTDKQKEQAFALIEKATEEAPGKKVVIEMKGVEFLSSLHLDLLIRMHKQLEKSVNEKRPLRLENVAPQIAEVFAITHLNELFDVHVATQPSPDGSVDSTGREDGVRGGGDERGPNGMIGHL